MSPDASQAFNNFLATQSVQIPVVTFIVNLVIAAVLSFLLSRVYVKYADSLSNRKLFARNFLMITMTTMLIISIVKTSLALSLGLVGALSIVRFRAAIKEPEELGYLFLAIGIGLGFGADQGFITTVALIIITLTIVLRKKIMKKIDDRQNLQLAIYSHNPEKVKLEEVLETLKRHCSSVDLKRFDETEKELEASFFVDFHDYEQLTRTKYALQGLGDSVKVSFLDNKGVI